MKETGYILGEWKAVCDSCGFDFLASDLKLRWDGKYVCAKDWETRHPQEFVRARPEKITPPWSRPADPALTPFFWTDNLFGGLRRFTWRDGAVSTFDWSDNGS